MDKKMNRKKKLEGVVVSNKMTSTVVVSVEFRVPHPRYSKIVTVTKKYFAHTNSPLNIGDKVMIIESKPYSKNVKWLVINK